MKSLLDQRLPHKPSVCYIFYIHALSAFSQMVDQELICVSAGGGCGTASFRAGLELRTPPRAGKRQLRLLRPFSTSASFVYPDLVI